MNGYDLGQNDIAVDNQGDVWYFIEATQSWHYIVPGRTENELTLSWDGFADYPPDQYAPYTVVNPTVAPLIRRSIRIYA